MAHFLQFSSVWAIKATDCSPTTTRLASSWVCDSWAWTVQASKRHGAALRSICSICSWLWWSRCRVAAPPAGVIPFGFASSPRRLRAPSLRLLASVSGNFSRKIMVRCFRPGNHKSQKTKISTGYRPTIIYRLHQYPHWTTALLKDQHSCWDVLLAFIRIILLLILIKTNYLSLPRYTL